MTTIQPSSQPKKINKNMKKRPSQSPESIAKQNPKTPFTQKQGTVFPPIEDYAQSTNASLRNPNPVYQIPPQYPNLPNLQNPQQVYGNGNVPNLDFNTDESSENIKVCLRIRPFSLQEKGRNDTKCITVMSNDQLVFINKNIRRNYTYNLVFGEDSTQEDIFYNCSINKLLDSAMDGYSVTVFAYGQTGSGKTYTIMGRDDSINEKILTNDKYSGIMPKSIKYIWSAVGNRDEKFYIKVSFLEIYNEQINDLLNPGNTNLQIRWDQILLSCSNNKVGTDTREYSIQIHFRHRQRVSSAHARSQPIRIHRIHQLHKYPNQQYRRLR